MGSAIRSSSGTSLPQRLAAPNCENQRRSHGYHQALGVRGLVRRVTAITPQMQEKEAAAISTERAPSTMDGCNIRASAVGSVNQQTVKTFGLSGLPKVLTTSATPFHSKSTPGCSTSASSRQFCWRVVSYCTHLITNAAAEGMNSKIMSIKRRVGGFRNVENYKTAIFFYCGGLDLYPRQSRMDRKSRVFPIEVNGNQTRNRKDAAMNLRSSFPLSWRRVRAFRFRSPCDFLGTRIRWLASHR